MVTLRYMFWVMALFLLGGCAVPSQQTLQYRWDVLSAESSSGANMNFIYAANSYSPSAGTGLDYSNGVLLNQRKRVISEANFADNSTITNYRVHYRDSFNGRSRNQMSLWHSVQDYSTVRRDVSFIIESQ